MAETQRSPLQSRQDKSKPTMSKMNGKTQSMAQIPTQVPQFITPEQFRIESMKDYLPSRFNVPDRVDRIQYSQYKALSQMEQQLDEIDAKFNEQDEKQNQLKQKVLKQVQAQKIDKPEEYKTKPLRRQENDLMIYKEIFVQPKQQKLSDLKEKEKDFEELFHRGTAKQYEKILNIYDEEKEKQKIVEKTDDSKNKQSQQLTISLKDDIALKQAQSGRPLTKDQELYQLLQESLTLLEKNLHLDTFNQAQPYFFDQQMQVQPPDLPNATIASPLTPGNGYAPSIPLTINFNDNKTNIRDLLVRSKAGMQAGDRQKEAHLSYYLGMVYESNRNYVEAMKFYKKFYACAQMMEDKIGQALGANRIAVNYFNNKDYNNAIEYHKLNIELSDIENKFAGYYNIGIAYRKIQNYEESLTNFQKALDWSRQRDDLQSECLAQGQLGLTHNIAKQYKESLEHFSNCYEISKKLKNTKLQLDCLINITKIISLNQSKTQDDTIKYVKDAANCAKMLGDTKTAALCICNIGVLVGTKNYENYLFNIQEQLKNKKKE